MNHRYQVPPQTCYRTPDLEGPPLAFGVFLFLASDFWGFDLVGGVSFSDFGSVLVCVFGA